MTLDDTGMAPWQPEDGDPGLCRADLVPLFPSVSRDPYGLKATFPNCAIRVWAKIVREHTGGDEDKIDQWIALFMVALRDPQ